MGIFGGTFDPVHNGHLRSAFELLEGLPLSELRLIPCGEPPHRGGPVADGSLRLEFLRLAVGDEPGFVVDDREVVRDGPSYSIDTLESLRGEFPDASICLIIGMDAFLSFDRWHRADEILGLAHLVVAHRPGWTAPDDGPSGEFLRRHRLNDANDLVIETCGRIYVHAVTQLEISSTAIREMMAEGKDPRYLLPEPVRLRMKESACYAAPTGKMTQQKENESE